MRAAYAAGRRRVLLVSPTGSGKTVVFTHVLASAVKRGKRVLILAHRVELLDQISAPIDLAGVAYGVIAPGHAETDAPVQIASVASLSRKRRLDRWRDRFDFIVVDEAHHAVAGSWAAVLASQPRAHVLGVTATPERLDGLGLGAKFEAMVLGPPVAALMADRWLCGFVVYAPAAAPDLSKAHIRAGDFATEDIRDGMGGVVIGAAVAEYRRLCPGVPTVCFAVDIEHSQSVAARFRDAGVVAIHIDGETSAPQRRRAIAGLADGSVEVICNCGLISEGLDVPNIGAIIMLRPTAKSRVAPSATRPRASARAGKGPRDHSRFRGQHGASRHARRSACMVARQQASAPAEDSRRAAAAPLRRVRRDEPGERSIVRGMRRRSQNAARARRGRNAPGRGAGARRGRHGRPDASVRAHPLGGRRRAPPAARRAALRIQARLGLASPAGTRRTRETRMSIENDPEAMMAEPPDDPRIIKLASVRESRRRQTSDLPPWLDDAIFDDRGRVMPILRNVAMALRSAPQLAEAFAYDELEHQTIVTRDLPLAAGAEPRAIGSVPRSLMDGDAAQVAEWLQSLGMPRVGVKIVRDAISLRAQERAFHPIRDYLNALRWDGVKRLSRWLILYLGAARTPYINAIGRMFLIACVARVFRPGCQADYMLIWEGGQGIAKSSACRLLGGDWFSDCLPDLSRGKETSQHLRGKWIIEIGELSAFSRAESEALKTFLTKREEKYRPPYGDEEVTEPRQCLFIGTTNKEAYLKDETGGRRFWPFKGGDINLKALADDRDQLFAEAVVAYRAGERWWPDAAFEREYIEPEQEARFEADAWEPMIEAFLKGRSRVQVSEVARGALDITAAKIGTAEQRRITTVLLRLGWTAKRDWRGRGYIPRLANDA